VVSRVNSLGTQIASLNERIAKYEIDGSRANDLRDQRAVLIDELSQYANIDVEEREFNEDYAAGKYPNPEDRGKSDTRLSIRINGFEFVNNWDVNTLNVVPRTTERNPMDATGLYDIVFSNGVEFDMYSPTLKGELKGLIDVRDGNNGNSPAGQPVHQYKGIPYYLEELNTLVRTFAKAINEGTDINGNKIPGMTGHYDGYGKDSDTKSGIWLFTYTTGQPSVEIGKDGTTTPVPGTNNYSGMNCFNFQVNSDIMEKVELLACSDVKDSDGGESNNKVILGFAALGNYQSLFKEGKLGDYVNAIASKLGVDAKQSTNFQKNYTDVTKTIDNQRLQVSGVSMNEEILNLVQYQQQFTAASKLMGIINDIYDTMINKMGV